MEKINDIIKILISKGETEEALLKLLSYFKASNNSLYNQVVLISNRYVKLKESDRKGIISSSELSEDINQINNSLIELIDNKLSQQKLIQSNDEDKIKSYKSFFSNLSSLNKGEIRKFNIISLVIILLAISIIFIPFENFIFNIEEEIGDLIDYIKIGFSLLTSLIPFWLQGLTSKRKEKIIRIETIMSLLGSSNSLTQEIENKIIDIIFKSGLQ